MPDAGRLACRYLIARTRVCGSSDRSMIGWVAPGTPSLMSSATRMISSPWRWRHSPDAIEVRAARALSNEDLQLSGWASRDLFQESMDIPLCDSHFRGEGFNAGPGEAAAVIGVVAECQQEDFGILVVLRF